MSIDFIFLTKRKIKTVSQGEIEKITGLGYKKILKKSTLAFKEGGTQKTMNFDCS
jgi:hypothetical protein